MRSEESITRRHLDSRAVVSAAWWTNDELLPAGNSQLSTPENRYNHSKQHK